MIGEKAIGRACATTVPDISVTTSWRNLDSLSLRAVMVERSPSGGVQSRHEGMRPIGDQRWPRVSDGVGRLDGRARVFERKALPVEDSPIAGGVEVAKAVREFDLFSVDGDGAVGPLPAGPDRIGQVLLIGGEEPTDVGVLQLEIAGFFSRFR